MKTVALFFIIALGLIIPTSNTAAPAIQVGFSSAKTPFPHRWERLGSRKVDYLLDRDEIFVTAREGRFTSLKLQVDKGGINLHRVIVHFADGSTQSVEVNHSIPAGASSRQLDLKGNRRVINKVVFFYDTKNFSHKKATITLWGKH